MPKAPKSPGVRDQRHNPLAEEYAPSDPWKNKAPKRQKRNKSDKEDDEQKYVDSKSSRKILEIGRELEEEDARENKARRPQEANPAFDFETRMGEDDMPGEDLVQAEDDDEAWGDDDEEVEEVEIDANDLAAWNKFIPTDDNPIVWPGEEAQQSGPGTDLAALILEKIAAHEAGGEVQQPEIQGGGAPEDAIELPAKVVEGTAPSLVNLNIRETHKLNVHLYNALKKALYKPSAFFKGVVFPMLTDVSCTQRDAVIVASVVAKISVPVLHSAAALHRLCEIAAEQMSSDPDAAGPCNIFIKTLLEKKYALPFKVIDALVFHFLRFRGVGASSADAMDTESVAGDLGNTGKLPVIWHQCLLAFAQRYRNDITEDQREALLDLLLTRGHRSISAEVRRELLEGRGRGVMIEPPAVGIDGDDTMMMAVDA
ncbi:hypothetical protein IG631_03437 [Alternaria alternata]|nr:hypothetical protein IG631_03437 [Alternaria alternata]